MKGKGIIVTLSIVFVICLIVAAKISGNDEARRGNSTPAPPELAHSLQAPRPQPAYRDIQTMEAEKYVEFLNENEEMKSMFFEIVLKGNSSTDIMKQLGLSHVKIVDDVIEYFEEKGELAVANEG